MLFHHFATIMVMAFVTHTSMAIRQKVCRASELANQEGSHLGYEQEVDVEGAQVWDLAFEHVLDLAAAQVSDLADGEASDSVEAQVSDSADAQVSDLVAATFSDLETGTKKPKKKKSKNKCETLFHKHPTRVSKCGEVSTSFDGLKDHDALISMAQIMTNGTGEDFPWGKMKAHIQTVEKAVELAGGNKKKTKKGCQKLLYAQRFALQKHLCWRRLLLCIERYLRRDMRSRTRGLSCGYLRMEEQPEYGRSKKQQSCSCRQASGAGSGMGHNA